MTARWTRRTLQPASDPEPGFRWDRHGSRRRADRSRLAHLFLAKTLAILVLFSATAARGEPPCRIRLTDITSSSGVTFQHHDGGSGKQYLIELMVAGLALFDYDGDGRVDIYFLNGAPTRGSTPPKKPWRNALYRNRGDGTFVDVTQSAGVGDTGHGLGVTVGDYDNDGAPDLYVNNYGPNVLYRNNGDGTFSETTQQAGVAAGDRAGAGASFLDIEGDGDLDLYAAHYVKFSYERHAVRSRVSYPYPPGPDDYPPVADSLFRNNGDGTFEDISIESGIATVAGPAMGMICCDYDEDGDTDVFVCNDGEANFLFQNDGRGRFNEVGLLTGTAYNVHGQANGSMGVDSGDFDGDGRLDLFMTDYTAEAPVLYRSLPGGLFEDATNAAGAGAAVFPHTNWGTGLVDLDNDGDRDLFIACGHFLSHLPEFDTRTRYRVKNYLLVNDGQGRFRDVTDQAGPGMAVVESSRGAGFDDLDNDGDIDIVVLNANARPTILRNDSPVSHHWLELQLVGRRSNRDAVGSRVIVANGNLTQLAEVHSGRSYQSHYGSRLHFGLGAVADALRVEVRWHGGDREVFDHVPVDRFVILRQGAGRRLGSTLSVPSR